jgi:serine protease
VRDSATSSAKPAGEIAYDRSAPEGVRPDEEAPLSGLFRAAIVLVLLLPHFLAGAASAATGDVPSGRLLVKFRAQYAVQGRVERLAQRHGLPVVATRDLGPRSHVLTLLIVPAADREAEILAALRADPAVEAAEPDRIRYAHAAPNDPEYANQWFLQAPNPIAPVQTISAVDAVTAWNSGTGSAGLVIAQLDTGVLFNHPDLLRAQDGGRLLPGYDFVGPDAGSNTFLHANDGDGWDPDPSDPGDWMTAADLKAPAFAGCSQATPTASSWHGTRTAGILGALTNNGIGVAGLTWTGWILPVRVLGKCGGYDSDIIVGMQWAGGISVAGVGDNPYPAQIINMSLGGPGACTSFFQDAIDALAARGALVVASAGNSGLAPDTPGNCARLATIGGLRHVGTKVGYSSLGPGLTISAPAGNCGAAYVAGMGPCLYSIETTSNAGSMGPAANSYTNNFLTAPNLGTSFSAPIVAGIAGLMLSANGNLTPAQLIGRLKEGALPFPQTSADTQAGNAQPPMCQVPTAAGPAQNTECICTLDGQTCGAGMANAPRAVAAALRPIAAVRLPASVAAGQIVNLDASGSGAACGHTVQGYSWTIKSGPGALVHPTGPMTQLDAPSSGTTVVALVVTDGARSDEIDITLTSSTISALSASSGSAAPTQAGARACLIALSPAATPTTVTLTPSAITVAPGAMAALTWTSTHAIACMASGGTAGDGWGGVVGPSGVATVQSSALGAHLYAIACFGNTVSTQAQASVTVSNPPPASGGGGGGGSADLTLLAALAGLALARGRRRFRG